MSTKSLSLLSFVFAVIASVWSVGSTAVFAKATTQAVYTQEGVAIKGYDPVAYFTQGKPVKGSPKHKATFSGAEWHFSSAENRDLFESDPQKYAPQYGGYCAWGVSAKGKAFATSPQAWRIVDNKLYLNYDKNVQSRWTKDTNGHISSADKKWPKLKKNLQLRGS